MLKIINSKRGIGVTYSHGGTVAVSSVVRDITAIGYKRVDRIENLGEFCVRGDILDIYATPAIRIMFFGDEIETIKEINPADYATIKKIDTVSIAPFPDGETMRRVRGKINLDYNEIRVECFIDAHAPRVWFARKIPRKLRLKSCGYNRGDLTHFKHETNVGDLVMHERYGLGRYLGAKRTDIGAGLRDYFVLQYDRQAIIYVPIENAELLYNYHGTYHRLDRI